MGVFGPHAVQIGSSSIVNMTIVQAVWRAAAGLMPIVRKTTAVTTAISAALTAHSTNRLSIYLRPFPWLRTSSSRRSISSLLKTLASTMPVTSSSTDP
jgi:hypothetical protein